MMATTNFMISNFIAIALYQLRFVCMSDTHSLTSHIKKPIPDGDVFVHAGDFTRTGKLSEVREFNAWIAKVDKYSRNLVHCSLHLITVLMACVPGILFQCYSC